MDDAWDELAEYLFNNFRAVDGKELNDLMQFVMRLLEKQGREARRQERRLLYVRASTNARSQN